ncbi:hypothetical protein ACEWY4_015385 [Coilia grayii]|uniref:Cadherin domain-containing protein n=1 Tax=Coilia grayii TaxID=363190 RepID=A0ABD1JP09_9TELE
MGRTRILFDSADKRFKVDTDGTVKLKRQVTLHDGHKRFAVHAWDSQGKKHTVDVRLELVQPHHHQLHHEHQVDFPKPAATEAVSTVPVLLFPKSSGGLKRRKRDWIIPDIKIAENTRGPFPERLVQIKTSYAKEVTVIYSITGAGADQEPRGLFTIDSRSGQLFITKPLDREDKATYLLFAHAVIDGGGKAEEPMELNAMVIDQNDNKPVFKQNPFLGSIAEASKPGTEFMDIVATDADEPGNANSDIRYKIISQDPQEPSAGMFSINPVTGKLMVNSAGLDKEKYPKYTLEIQAADMEGEGLTAQCKAIISITDSNDHAPQFKQPQYTVSVPENKVGELVVKMPVTDGDDPNTEAWAAKFKIISGDTGGMFSIETDMSKQAGIIKTAKPLDFEAVNKYTLVVAVENEIPFAIRLRTATAQVVVNVKDVNEAPIFSPVEKRISTREDDPVGTRLVLYSATDPDKAIKQTVMYKIGSDPAGWLMVEKDTGVIKVKSPMDRESPLVKDGQYKALILAMDNYMTPATGTGTLLIQLEDVNDNAPAVVERMVEVCNDEPSPVLLTVMDGDTAVNGAPYRVELKGESASNWTVWMSDTTLVSLMLVYQFIWRKRNVEGRVSGMNTSSMMRTEEETTSTRILFDSADKRFKVDTDGTVKLKRQVTLHDGHKRFAVHAWDSQGKKHTVDVRLELVQLYRNQHYHHQLDFYQSSGGLKRRKRDWIIPDIQIPENTRGPFPEPLVQLLAHVMIDGGGKAEESMELDITVIDRNDNKPVFKQNPFLGSVAEASKPGTEFMDIVATDADEPGNDNSDIRYKILSQDPQQPSAGMFSINPVTGKLMVNSAGLDKEYTVSVPENKVGELVVKMPVTDGDDPNTEAWAAKFKIISGDTGGMFSIETDISKQAGIIKTTKPLDFEAVNKYTLVVAVENEIPFAIPVITATAQVVVNVKDVNDAPIFNPVEKRISTREDDPVGTRLVLYSATDPDTAMKQAVT